MKINNNKLKYFIIYFAIYIMQNIHSMDNTCQKIETIFTSIDKNVFDLIPATQTRNTGINLNNQTTIKSVNSNNMGIKLNQPSAIIGNITTSSSNPIGEIFACKLIKQMKIIKDIIKDGQQTSNYWDKDKTSNLVQKLIAQVIFNKLDQNSEFYFSGNAIEYGINSFIAHYNFTDDVKDLLTSIEKLRIEEVKINGKGSSFLKDNIFDKEFNKSLVFKRNEDKCQIEKNLETLYKTIENCRLNKSIQDIDLFKSYINPDFKPKENLFIDIINPKLENGLTTIIKFLENEINIAKKLDFKILLEKAHHYEGLDKLFENFINKQNNKIENIIKLSELLIKFNLLIIETNQKNTDDSTETLKPKFQKIQKKCFTEIYCYLKSSNKLENKELITLIEFICSQLDKSIFDKEICETSFKNEFLIDCLNNLGIFEINLENLDKEKYSLIISTIHIIKGNKTGGCHCVKHIGPKHEYSIVDGYKISQKDRIGQEYNSNNLIKSNTINDKIKFSSTFPSHWDENDILKFLSICKKIHETKQIPKLENKNYKIISCYFLEEATNNTQTNTSKENNIKVNLLLYCEDNKGIKCYPFIATEILNWEKNFKLYKIITAFPVGLLHLKKLNNQIVGDDFYFNDNKIDYSKEIPFGICELIFNKIKKTSNNNRSELAGIISKINENNDKLITELETELKKEKNNLTNFYFQESKNKDTFNVKNYIEYLTKKNKKVVRICLNYDNSKYLIILPCILTTGQSLRSLLKDKLKQNNGYDKEFLEKSEDLEENFSCAEFDYEEEKK